MPTIILPGVCEPFCTLACRTKPLVLHLEGIKRGVDRQLIASVVTKTWQLMQSGSCHNENRMPLKIVKRATEGVTKGRRTKTQEAHQTVDAVAIGGQRGCERFGPPLYGCVKADL